MTLKQVVASRAKFLCTIALSALALAPLAAHAQDFSFSTAVGGAVPDANVAGVSSTITVADNFVFTNFTSLIINGLTHTWTGDIIITLSHGSTTVDILDRVRGNGNTANGDGSDLNGNYTFVTTGGADFSAAAGTIGNTFIIPSNVNYATVPVGNTAPTGGVSSANGLLSDFAGQNVNGAWILTISDRLTDDTGSFTGWGFTVNNPVVVPESGTFALFAAGAVALIGVIRRKK